MMAPRPYPDATVGEISRLLDQWLSQKRWKPSELIRLLTGDDLPAVDPVDEPCVWLLRAIGTGADGAEREAGLARRLGKFIDREPDVKRPGPRPEHMLYNLLSLCAGINRPDELAGPLLRMLERRRLKGAWNGLSLRSQLRAALASNQADTRLEPVWLAMARGEPHEFLEGNRIAGLNGILLMPLPESEDPPADTIGAALGAIARYLENVPRREGIFTRLIERAERTYQAGPVLVSDLVWWAFCDSWPPWARKCLADKLPDRDGLPAFIHDAGVEYDGGVARPEHFAEHVATYVQLALQNTDQHGAATLRKKRRARLRRAGVAA
jgi:hypothetical protein